jgi:DNA/RNA endonuclease YhcR with UshA esterase domain
MSTLGKAITELLQNPSLNGEEEIIVIDETKTPSANLDAVVDKYDDIVEQINESGIENITLDADKGTFTILLSCGRVLQIRCNESTDFVLRGYLMHLDEYGVFNAESIPSLPDKRKLGTVNL